LVPSSFVFLFLSSNLSPLGVGEGTAGHPTMSNNTPSQRAQHNNDVVDSPLLPVLSLEGGVPSLSQCHMQQKNQVCWTHIPPRPSRWFVTVRPGPTNPAD
jgi:hypothetical protein